MKRLTSTTHMTWSSKIIAVRFFLQIAQPQFHHLSEVQLSNTLTPNTCAGKSFVSWNKFVEKNWSFWEFAPHRCGLWLVTSKFQFPHENLWLIALNKILEVIDTSILIEVHHVIWRVLNLPLRNCSLRNLKKGRTQEFCSDHGLVISCLTEPNYNSKAPSWRNCRDKKQKWLTFSRWVFIISFEASSVLQPVKKE